MKGDMLASTDADGVVRLWDVRMVAEIAAIASGPHPCNAAAFDASGSSLAVGSDDGIVRFVSTQTCDIHHQMSNPNPLPLPLPLTLPRTRTLTLTFARCDIQHQMSGHNDAVQCCVFDRSSKFLVTGGSDATFRLWA